MSGHQVPEFTGVYVDHTGRLQPVRGRQCDDTCTTDCGRCKGMSNPQRRADLANWRADQFARTARHKADQAVRWATVAILASVTSVGMILIEVFWR